MVEAERLERLLVELERVIDYLERMNLDDRTRVPDAITEILVAAGLTDIENLAPSALLPRILDRQQTLRRRQTVMRRREHP